MELFIKKNPYNLPLESLFSLATRKNPKRSFLFVSKLLGKHIPVNPAIYQLGGRALALRMVEEMYAKLKAEEVEEIIHLLKNHEGCSNNHLSLLSHPLPLQEKATFIGFAETATALGQGMFDSFLGDHCYIHTTREEIPQYKGKIEFKEEHSHATSHYLYNMNDSTFSKDRMIVLVDDELTTGKTALNIIEALHNKYPREKYVVASILDWRSEADRHAFKEKERKLNITIEVISLIEGEYQISNREQDTEIMISLIASEVTKELKDSQINYYRLDEVLKKKVSFGDIPYLVETGRFGIHSDSKLGLHQKLRETGESLKAIRKGSNTLCLGTGEFIYLPMVISAWMGTGIKFHSTTRSPIYPFHEESYAINSGINFKSPEDEEVVNYLYNIPSNYYDEVFIFLERERTEEQLKSLLEGVKSRGIPYINIITCIGKDEKPKLGSYPKEDVTFLLKELGENLQEKDTQVREKEIQGGTHYSEMLPVEYRPSQEYIDLFHQSLKDSGEKLAVAVGVVAEKIVKTRGKNLVLVSLARAGTPIGILIRRYLKYRYGMDLNHYSISIIRGKGFDLNALRHIIKFHPGKEIQFIDGWTGKGAIASVLSQSCDHVREVMGINLDDSLAVLADPGHCSRIFGSREDFLIPSACLNATVSGLISRTVHRTDLIAEGDFHGVKFYKSLIDEDLSNHFVDHISAYFPKVIKAVEEELEVELKKGKISSEVTWRGLKDIETIQKEFNIEDINLIKPGIGETTRVLLRRVPWKVLVKDVNHENLKHILVLAQEKGVEVEVYQNMTYQCCGLIKPLGRKK